MEEAFVDALLEAQAQGLQTYNGTFKRTGWNMAFEAVRACTSQALTMQQVKSKFDTVKQEWRAWKAFLGHTGLGENGVPTAPLDVLEQFFHEHPRARKFRDRPIPYEGKLQTLLDGVAATGESGLATGENGLTTGENGLATGENGLATGENATTIGNAMQHVLIHSKLEEPEAPDEIPLNNGNHHRDQSETTTEEHEWPNSPPPSAAPDRDGDLVLVARGPTTPSNPASTGTDTSQNRRDSNLRLRKRKSRNAGEADLRKRKKSSGHALADAIEQTVEEWKNTNKLFANQLQQRDDITRRQFERQEKEDIIGRVVNVLVFEFEELSVVEQDFVNSVLENRSKALLFLAQTPERRRTWVNQLLSQRHQGQASV
jgi:Myb/SANT-like DNA-binding domain